MVIGIDVRCLARGKSTGVEEYTINLLTALFERDRTNNYILFFNAWKGAHVSFSWVQKYDNVIVKTFHIPNKLLNFSLWFFRFPKLDKLLGGTDVFFAPNINFFALSPETKKVLTIHDLSFEHYTGSFSLKRRIWHYCINPRLLCRTFDKIIVVSDATREDAIATYGIDGGKVQRVYNGVTSVEVKKKDANDLQNAHNLPATFILYFGTIEPRKNIVSLIKAYDALCARTQSDTMSLVIAGARGWKAGEIYRAIKNSPYAEDIYVLHDLTEKEKVALYSLAKVFVYPSHFEGFGFPVLEAFVAGVPVITSHAESLPEVVGYSAVIVDPERPEEIYLALKELLSSQELCAQLTAKGKGRIKKFTWERAAEEILEVFESLKK